MLSKFARASASVSGKFLYQKSSFVGPRQNLSSNSFARSTNHFQFSHYQSPSSYFSNFFITIPNTRLLSKSLAEEILKQKQEEQSKKEGDQQKNDAGDEDKEKKSFWKYWKIYAVMFTLFTGSSVNLAYLYSLPEIDEHGNNIPDEYKESASMGRLLSKIKSKKEEVENPFSDKLLPDPLPYPYHQPEYTICLELTGLLVHSDWSTKHGWRFQKRPGLDIFLSQVGYPHFELVIYTVENAMSMFNVCDGLDPQQQHINYRLFRDATQFVNNHPTKVVNELNRDPKKVIHVDWNKDSVALSLDNALILKKWEGDTDDTSLIGLAQLLQAIKQTNVDDVREVLSYYRQHDDPIEVFRENQRKLQEEMAVNEEKLKKDVQSKPILSSMSGLSFMRRRT